MSKSDGPPPEPPLFYKDAPTGMSSGTWANMTYEWADYWDQHPHEFVPCKSCVDCGMCNNCRSGPDARVHRSTA